jgi:transglutaminase-like putative cysteine protease
VSTVGEYDVDFEQGEGDAFDKGRVWYSEDDTVTNLVWTRHRWRTEDGEERALDVGFDRKTAANARTMTEADELLAEYRVLLGQHAADPANALPDGRVHGMPMAAFSGEAKPSAPEFIAAWQSYFTLAYAVASYDCNAVAPLARSLARIANVSQDATTLDEGARYRLATALARFVQGVRYAVPDKLRSGLRPPVSTLVYRVGDCDSRSVLLALLLRHCGFDAGLFVSGAESHAICAAGVPLPIGADADPAAIQAAVAAWAQSVGREMPRVWSAQPATPEAGAPTVLYVPVECTGYWPVGEVGIQQPDSWCFLPFSAVQKQVGLTESADPTDEVGFVTDNSEATTT